MTAYTYILECRDNTLYTGYTTDLKRRLEEHKNSIGSKYTKKHGARRFVYAIEHETKSEAMRHECAIKKLSRQSKLELISCYSASTAQLLQQSGIEGTK